MIDFLAGMAKSSEERAANAVSFTDADFDKPVVPLTPEGFGVIAEIKQRSPAEGELSASKTGAGHLASRANAYAAGGAAAISVLTEPSRFDGTLAHLNKWSPQFPKRP